MYFCIKLHEMLHSIQLRLKPKQAAAVSDKQMLIGLLSVHTGLSSGNINDARIVKRSIDARKSPVMVNLTITYATGEDSKVEPVKTDWKYQHIDNDSAPKVVIIGAGPAGLFAALKALTLGIKPIVLERGEDVDSRRIRLAEISRNMAVNPDSNYSFGEGGAGAYSDGKLYTRSKKRGNVREVLSVFVEHGANQDILVDAHPHIGSDKLPAVIKAMRETILKHGGEVHFNSRVVDIIVNKNRITGVVDNHGKEYFGSAVILATGHSARDVYTMIYNKNIAIQAKGLAIGVRLEHPQHLIDKIQYHSPEGRGKYLPAAEYSFVTQVEDRGVYSFCMCPGGVVVPAATEPDQLVVNGMSASARASQWANSGMVVEIHPDDFPEYANRGELRMMYLQQDLEHRWFEEADHSLNAPAQRMKDFVDGKASTTIPRSSYPAGVHPARIDQLLPPFIASRLQKGLKEFGRKSKGFLSNEAILVGLESRTSSPVRIPRDKESLNHIEISNLYPAGEGAGYAGGIVSAAIDGIRCMDACANSLINNE